MINVKVIDALSEGKKFIALFDSENPVYLKVTGGSMLPLLKSEKSTVMLKKLDKEPRIGDILLFRRKDGSFVLHRVRKVCGDVLLMNGDAQDWCEKINRDTVIAEVVRIFGEKVYSKDSLKMKLYQALWWHTYGHRGRILKAVSVLKKKKAGIR